MVMRRMETNYCVPHCVKDPEINCKIYKTCVIHEFLDTIEAALSGVVDNVTIQDICDRYAQKNGSEDALVCANGEAGEAFDVDDFLFEELTAFSR